AAFRSRPIRSHTNARIDRQGSEQPGAFPGTALQVVNRWRIGKPRWLAIPGLARRKLAVQDAEQVRGSEPGALRPKGKSRSGATNGAEDTRTAARKRLISRM